MSCFRKLTQTIWLASITLSGFPNIGIGIGYWAVPVVKKMKFASLFGKALQPPSRGNPRPGPLGQDFYYCDWHKMLC